MCCLGVAPPALTAADAMVINPVERLGRIDAVAISLRRNGKDPLDRWAEYG
jgi:hypothetical protein